MSPKQFLQEIGLKKKPELDSASDEYIDAIKREGFGIDSVRDQFGFGPAAGDAFFCSEKVARATLYGDRRRISEHLQHLGEFGGFPKVPRKIAEIGAGAGIPSLFLAKNHPEAEVCAFDWADRPLKFGQLLANELRVPNISFHRASYEDLANGADPGGHDLVLSLYGLSFQDHDEEFDRFTDGVVTPPANFQLMASAIARLLSPITGVGAICGNWTQWGALNLFEALRRAKLTVDWDITFTKGKVENNVFITNLGYVFVRSGIAPITSDCREDVQAFFASGEIDDLKSDFSIGATPALLGLFKTGRQLVRIALHKNGLEHAVSLFCQAGLLLLEHRTSNGFHRGCLKSLCNLRAQLEKIETVLSQLELDATVYAAGSLDKAIAYLIPDFPLIAKCAHTDSSTE